MGMAVKPLYYTADMVRALPDDGNRYETVYGELLVSPSPRPMHQVVLHRLTLALGNFPAAEPVGQLLSSPADISWGPDILVQPDLFVASIHELRTGTWSEVRTLPLAIEILSPSTARYDRFTKRRLYQSVGIPDYWVVDIDEGLIERWTPGLSLPQIERDRIEWRPGGVSGVLAIDVGALFRPI